MMNITTNNIIKRKIAVIVLALALVFTGLSPLSGVDYADADLYYDGGGFTGKNCTLNKTAAACIDYVLKKYPAGSKYPGSGECWGYAETVSNLLASSRSQKNYTGLKLTKKNFLNKCRGVKAGTHFRVSKSKTLNGGWGHSVVLLKVTEDDVIWADNNGIGAYNIVAYHRSTAEEFVNQYSNFNYINMVTEPTKYRISATSKLAASSDSEKGVINLAWTRASGAKKYQVYRSYSKNGSYKCIATTTDAAYEDPKVGLGKKVYYKVKAVKSSGSTMSNIGTERRKLSPPKVTAANDEKTGKPLLSWEPVPNATSYTIYSYNLDTGKTKRLKNTTKCTFIDQASGENGNPSWNYYGVKAIYSKNINANSAMSDYVEGYNVFPAPKNLTVSYYDKQIHLTWTKVAGAEGYEVYMSDAIDGTYQSFGISHGTTYDGYWDTPGIWYFKVEAYDGVASEPVSVQIQDWEINDSEIDDSEINDWEIDDSEYFY